VAINEPYRSGRINVYVVKARAEEAQPSVSRGNAAYVASSDIVFIESSYFDFGEKKTFEAADDPLVAAVVSPLRVHAFFVLAHELGHRQLHRENRWFSFLSQTRNHAREIEADDYAIMALKKLYGDENARRAAGIPEPVSTFAGFLSDELTPLQRISDHLGYSVAFLSEDLFESPFPILTGSGTHPAFFSRLRGLLERLKVDATGENDEDALRQLELIESVTAATDYLINLGPTEVEFDHPFQYAYLDRGNLFVVGNDQTPIVRIPLSELQRGRQYRQKNPKPQGIATVRYAWSGKHGEALLLRRDGHLNSVEIATGKVKLDIDLADELGDSSCVKQFVLPPQPGLYAYATYCTADVPQISLISNGGGVTRKDFVELVDDAPGDPVQIKSFDLDAGGRPTLIYTKDDQAFATTMSEELVPTHTRPLGVAASSLSGPISVQGAKAMVKSLVLDAAGQAYYLAGSPLFRKISMYDAEAVSTTPVAKIDLAPSVRDGDLNELLTVISAFAIGHNRQIVNLGEGGAYLIDFEGKVLHPLRRHGFDAMEQVASNAGGIWIYFRKYGRRILVFREQAHG
jgi:hypothetical protein